MQLYEQKTASNKQRIKQNEKNRGKAANQTKIKLQRKMDSQSTNTHEMEGREKERKVLIICVLEK